MTLDLRPAGPGDREFQLAVYAAARQDEMALTGWAPQTVAAFVAAQFETRAAWYALQFPCADRRIVVADGADAGVLVVDRTPNDLHLVDIALLPEHRGHGIGTCLLRDLQAEARATGRRLRCHVAVGNRARGLYARLGFQTAGTAGMHERLEWLPVREGVGAHA